jgi:hypothetical protein
MAGYLQQVNRMKIRPELLREVIEMHAEMAQEDRPVFEERVFRIIELLKEKGIRPSRVADIAIAIDFRLTALARLQRDSALREWSRPSGDLGAIAISINVIAAAAEEKLIENDEGQAVFNPESFRRRVLAKTEPDGHA